ncbi:MAG: hypothetical protein AAFR96_02615 [Planctomycetota bacterium]
MAYGDPYNDDPYGDPYADPESLDPEAPSADDIARFDRDGAACPSCGAEVYDDAAVCPICSELLTDDDHRAKPWTLIVVGVLVLSFVLIYIL